MKLILVELQPDTLRLSSVETGGSKIKIIDTTRVPYPDEIVFPKILGDISLCVDFITQNIAKTQYTGKSIILILGDRLYTEKEFYYPKMSEKMLHITANFEAEAVLEGNVNEQSVMYYKYGDRTDTKDEYRATLYAFPKYILNALKKAFGKNGYKLIKVTPRSNTYVRALDQLVHKSQEYQTKCFAVLHMKAQNIHIFLYDHGTAIYTGCVKNASDEIMSTIMEHKNFSKDEAIHYLTSLKLYEDTDSMNNQEEANFILQLRMMVNMMIENVIRNVHFCSVSEKIEVEKILIGGVVSFMEGVAEHISTTYEVEVKQLFNEFSIQKKLLDINKNLPVETVSALPQIGACLDGINLLDTVEAEKKRKISTTVASIVLGVFALGVMAIQPVAYGVETVMVNQSKAKLDSDVALNIKQLLDQRDETSAQLDAIQKDYAYFPYEASKTTVYLEELVRLMKGSTINSYFYDHDSGIINVVLEVKEYTDILPISERINESNLLELAVPFSATSKDDKVTYTVGLSVRQEETKE